MNVPDADTRPPANGNPKAAARWQHRPRLAGDRQPAMAEWGPSSTTSPPCRRRLHRCSPHASRNCRRRRQRRALLCAAPREGALPDDHAAAAVVADRPPPHPAVAAALDTDQPLAAAWTTTLADTIGADRATELQSSRWWPALITAVDHGIRQAGPPPTSPHPHRRQGQVDDCLALVWRISTLTTRSTRRPDAACRTPTTNRPPTCGTAANPTNHRGRHLPTAPKPTGDAVDPSPPF